MSINKGSIAPKALAGLAVIAGIILIAVAPERIMIALNQAVKIIYDMAEMTQMKEFIVVSDILKFLYPLWTGLAMATGAALLMLALPLFRRDYWARPLAIGFLALPAIGGAFISGTLMLVAKDLVGNGVVLLLSGIIPYVIFVVVDKTPVKETVIRFFVFLSLIAGTAINFVSGFASLMQNQLTQAMDPLAINFAFTLGTNANFIAVVILVLAIPMLAGRMKLGLWLASTGMALMIVGSGTFYLGHSHIALYLPATLVAIASLTLLTVFGGRLVNHNQPSKWVILPLDKTE